jgi:hypothetical protein
MSTAEKVYASPQVLSANDIPKGVLNYLNGEDLLSKTQALRLSTVDPDGWPKASENCVNVPVLWSSTSSY